MPKASAPIPGAGPAKCCAPSRPEAGRPTTDKPCLPAFDPKDLPESNAASYPEKFKAINSRRRNRQLSDHVGLANFGVNPTRIELGAEPSARHAHSKQDEFIWVAE